MTIATNSPLVRVDDWWELPTGKVVSVRRIEGEASALEAVVRYVDSDAGMAQGEFNLSVRYVARGRRVVHG